MKLFMFILLGVFLSVNLGWAKKTSDLQKFNQDMQEYVQSVMENNPETYEVKQPSRGPASVPSPISEDSKTEEERRQNMLKNNLGLQDW